MSVKLAFNRYEQFANTSGVPYAGAKLFTYVGGSVNTKQTTYTESTGSTPNTNPIVLDSAGQLPQPVWLTTGASYKFVLAPSTDTDPPVAPIWTLDGITGINDSSASQSEWIAGPTPTFVSATSFTLVGDQTSTFTVGRRVKTTNTTGTIYSTITASAFAASTTVTVVNDSGNIDSGLSAVSYGMLSAANSSIPHTSSSSTGLVFQDAVTAGGKFTLSGVITPTQITAAQNDYSPTGLSTSSTLRINSDAARTITGLSGGAEGRIIVIHNTGSFAITLSRQDAASTAANRFAFDANKVLATDTSITLRYDNTTARWRDVEFADGEYRSVQVFTAAGANTYTAPAGLKRAKITVVGAGGGGGGTALTGGAQWSIGSGGAAGGTAIKTVSAATIGASQTVTIGAKGAGVSGANGTAGGTTSFGAIVTATGGAFGLVTAAGANPVAAGQTGGLGASGDINIRGGSSGLGIASNAGNFNIAGFGGQSTHGAGAPANGQGVGAGNNADANGFGGGGSGAFSNPGNGAQTGGNGADGLCIVEEFF